jgi:uncharacterized protein (TIGR02118 family)
MIKVVAFLTRLPGVDREAFKAYYENNHVPMVRKLLPMLGDGYERNYPDVSKVRPAEGQSLDEAVGFDALTVMRFENRNDYDAWKAAIRDPETLRKIQEDEAKFLDNTKTRMFVMDERKSA